MVKKFRKKQHEISAMKWDGTNYDIVKIFLGYNPDYYGGEVVSSLKLLNALVIKTLEGDKIACPGDWIIQDVFGDFYPCKPEIFEMDYEEIKDE
jgi:hypothetical protein